MDREVYLKRKKNYRRLYEMKKEEWNEELMKETKTQEQVVKWKVINRERKRKIEINGEIRTEEWEEYFRKILGKSESEIKLELGDQGRGKEKGEGKERELSWKEMERVIRKLKKRKAAGEDRLQNEV